MVFLIFSLRHSPLPRHGFRRTPFLSRPLHILFFFVLTATLPLFLESVLALCLSTLKILLQKLVTLGKLASLSFSLRHPPTVRRGFSRPRHSLRLVLLFFVVLTAFLSLFLVFVLTWGPPTTKTTLLQLPVSARTTTVYCNPAVAALPPLCWRVRVPRLPALRPCC